MSSGLSCRQSRPPKTFGWSVLRRPSIISGKPVYSETSRTGIPSSWRCLRVPPVLKISTPASASPRANAARPNFSLTLIRARRIGGDGIVTPSCRLSCRPGDGSGPKLLFLGFLRRTSRGRARKIGHLRRLRREEGPQRGKKWYYGAQWPALYSRDQWSRKHRHEDSIRKTVRPCVGTHPATTGRGFTSPSGQKSRRPFMSGSLTSGARLRKPSIEEPPCGCVPCPRP